MREFDHSVAIAATPARVLDAFFNEADLSAWWHVSRSLCHARSFGNYAVEWPPTEWTDDVLGRWGGAFRGTVIDFKPGKEFFIADAYWLPPDGEPIGPMAFEATCSLVSGRTVLHIRQSGFEHSDRWTRYYDVISTGLMVALEELKRHVEQQWND